MACVMTGDVPVGVEGVQALLAGSLPTYGRFVRHARLPLPRGVLVEPASIDDSTFRATWEDVGRPRLYARVEVARYAYRTERRLVGVCIETDDEVARCHLKLAFDVIEASGC